MPDSADSTVSVRARLRHRMRSSLAGMLTWYVARGLLSVRHAKRVWRSGRQFKISSRADGALVYEVIVADDYRLNRHTLAPTDIVVDIGAHIGSFGLLAHACGSRRIWSYEARSESFRHLVKNYEVLDGTTATHAAVFRSDAVQPETLTHSGAGGVGTVLFSSDSPMEWVEGEILPAKSSGSEEVRAIPLDEILREHKRVRILKIDCEGSEFPILLTSGQLERVDEIVGECHEISAEHYARMAPSSQIEGMSTFQLADLTKCLESQGFTVASTSAGPHMDLFQATRK